MARVTPIQNAFTAGELSPRMLSRTDLKGYREGAQEMTNFIPLSQGPAASRPGVSLTLRIQNCENARIISFPVAPDESYALIFTAANLQILSETGLPAGISIVTNGRFQQGSVGWTAFLGTDPGTKGIVTFALGSVLLNGAATNPAAVRQQLTTTAAAVYTIGVATGDRNNARIRVGTTAGGAEIGEFNMGSFVVQQFDFTATGTATWIEIACPSGRTADCIINSVEVMAKASAGTNVVSLASPYSAGQLRNIQYEMRPAGKTMYFTHPLVPPYRLVFTSPGTFVFELVTFTGAPTAWGEGNYPAALTFHDGRLWLAGTPLQPSQLWGSKSGVYDDFTIGTAADAALSYTIAKAGTIRWLRGVKSLLIGADNQEYVISAQGGVITPTDINIEPQSAYGSLAHQPISIGNQVIYIGSDARKLRAMGYRFEESGWVSTDLTFPSEHITKGAIFELAWAQNYNNIIWLADGVGNLIGCTYDRPNNLIGWHRHTFVNCQLRSVAALRLLGVDYLWVALKKIVNGLPEIHICVMIPSLDQATYVDDSKRVENLTTPFTVVTGLGHLEGEVVQVIADGAVHPVRTVTGGQITLQQPANTVIVGLAITPKLVTMPIEAGQNPTSTEAAMKRFNKIYVRTLQSMRPIINGVRPPTRFPSTPMNEQDPAIDEDIQTLNLGWNRREVITIEETLPVDCQVIAVMGEMGVN